MYVLIIIFIISNFAHFIDGMVLGNAKVNDHIVSDKINNLIVSEMKKTIKNVTDGTIIQLTFVPLLFPQIPWI